MATISGLMTIGAPDIYSSSTFPGEGLLIGQLAWDGKTGKAFRYTLNSSSAALIKGTVLQAAAQDTTYENMAVRVAGVVGDKFLAITNGTSTITSANFVNGSISVYTAGTVAICDEYTITGISGTLTTGGALKVWLDKPLRYAYTVSAKVNMKMSPWSNVVIAPTTCTEMLVGIAQYEIPASEYGWVQTHGICSARSDNGTFAVGSDIGSPITVEGSIGVFAAGTAQMRIGTTRMAKADAKGLSVFLQID
jgi:hypothetical protein